MQNTNDQWCVVTRAIKDRTGKGEIIKSALSEKNAKYLCYELRKADKEAHILRGTSVKFDHWAMTHAEYMR